MSGLPLDPGFAFEPAPLFFQALSNQVLFRADLHESRIGVRGFMERRSAHYLTSFLAVGGAGHAGSTQVRAASCSRAVQAGVAGQAQDSKPVQSLGFRGSDGLIEAPTPALAQDYFLGVNLSKPYCIEWRNSQAQ